MYFVFFMIGLLTGVLLVGVIITIQPNKKCIKNVKEISFCYDSTDITKATMFISTTDNSESVFKLKAGSEVKCSINVGETTATLTNI